MKYLQVVDWDKFQHYGKRNPPWIKLHNQILENYQYTSLPDSTKSHLIGIWLLASRTENKIPADARWLANKLGATSKVNIESLISSGFVEFIGIADDASNMLASNASTSLDSVEESRGEERQRRGRVEREERFCALWSLFDSAYGNKGSRKDALEAFIKIDPDDDFLDEMKRAVIDQIEHKVFLSNQGDGFVPSFPHVVNWLKKERWTDEVGKRVIRSKPESRHEQMRRETQEALASLEGEAGSNVEYPVQQRIGNDTA